MPLAKKRLPLLDRASLLASFPLSSACFTSSFVFLSPELPLFHSFLKGNRVIEETAYTRLPHSLHCSIHTSLVMFASTALAVAAALFAVPIAAKTDLAGCVSSATVAYGGASLIWYVPDTGEICEFLDCGTSAPFPTQRVSLPALCRTDTINRRRPGTTQDHCPRMCSILGHGFLHPVLPRGLRK